MSCVDPSERASERESCGFAIAVLAMAGGKRFKTFRSFYPFYLGEHRNGVCRLCHFLGSSNALALLGYALVSQSWQFAAAIPVAGYGPAWVGHFFFEKNRPATFKYPLWSFFGDLTMMFDIIRGRIPLLGELPKDCYRGTVED